VRVKRVLEGAEQQNPLISTDDVLRAVAVVYVEIDDGNAV
jgi:hypothetical protein